MVQAEKPLSGKRILITRPRKQSKEISNEIKLFGGIPVLLPLIKIRTLFDENEFNKFLAYLSESEIDYVVFMSVNSVKSLLSNARKFAKVSVLVKALRKSLIVAVGERTATYLGRVNIHVDIIPKKFSSEGVVRELLNRNVRNKIIYIPKTNSSNNHIKKQLEKSGAIIHEYYVYETVIPKSLPLLQDVVKQLLERKIWAITFMSPSTVRSFLGLAGRLLNRRNLISSLNQIVIAAIGSTTKNELEGEGILVDVVPAKHTSHELVLGLVKYAIYSKKPVKSD
ncbi:MAG TPA: uroporphyrinogen-III synthase [Thermodesulfobacteriota bacterium]|nr:uroporphyrinogen-III synthase [Thermodesulfobacteriota bacterium]